MIADKESASRRPTSVSESKPISLDNMYCLVYWPEQETSTIVHSRSVLDVPVPGMTEGQVFVKIGPQYVPGVVKARGTIEEMCTLERNSLFQDTPEQVRSYETVIIAETQSRQQKPEPLQSPETIITSIELEPTTAISDSRKCFELANSNSSVVISELERNSSRQGKLEQLQSHETLITETQMEITTTSDLQNPPSDSNSFTVVSVDFSPDHKINDREEETCFSPIASMSSSIQQSPPSKHSLSPAQFSSPLPFSSHVPIIPVSSPQGPSSDMLKSSNKRKRNKGLASHRVTDVYPKVLAPIDEERSYGPISLYQHSSSYNFTGEGYNEALASVGDVILPIVSSDVPSAHVPAPPSEIMNNMSATTPESTGGNSESKLQYLQGQIDCLMGRQMRLLQAKNDLELRVIKLESSLSPTTTSNHISSSHSHPNLSSIHKLPSSITSRPTSHVVLVGSSSNPTPVPILTPTLTPYVTDQLIPPPQISFPRAQETTVRPNLQRHMHSTTSKAVLQNTQRLNSKASFGIQQVMRPSEMRETLQSRPSLQLALNGVCSTGLRHSSFSGETPEALNLSLTTHPQVLLPVEEILSKYRDLQRPENITRLAVKIAREAVFGHDLLTRSTPFGHTHFDALPAEGMLRIKEAIRPFCAFETHTEFELIWKSCVQSIGQACKHSRRPPKPPGSATVDIGCLDV